MCIVMVMAALLCAGVVAQELPPQELYELGQLRQATADLQESWQAEQARLEAALARQEERLQRLREVRGKLREEQEELRRRQADLELALSAAKAELAALAPLGKEAFLQEFAQWRERLADSRSLRVRRELLQDPQGDLREFEILEIGLALKLAVNRAMGMAGLGWPDGALWRWKWNAEWSHSIMQAIDMVEGRRPAQVVELPLVVTPLAEGEK